jgi:hypothetical protein
MPSTRPPVQSPKELALANGSTDATTPSLEKGPDLQERPEI